MKKKILIMAMIAAMSVTALAGCRKWCRYIIRHNNIKRNNNFWRYNIIWYCYRWWNIRTASRHLFKPCWTAYNSCRRCKWRYNRGRCRNSWSSKSSCRRNRRNWRYWTDWFHRWRRGTTVGRFYVKKWLMVWLPLQVLTQNNWFRNLKQSPKKSDILLDSR